MSTANFSIVKQDMRMSNSVIQRLTAVDLKECQENCLLHKHCHSINFKNFGDNVCELNSQALDKVRRWNIALIAAKGWSMLSTDPNQLIVSAMKLFINCSK